MDSPTKAKISDLAKAGDAAGYMTALNDYLAQFDYKQGYVECIDFLDENFCFFLTHVLNMGKPRFDASVPTAAVYLPTDKSKGSEFNFIFNPTFFAMLDVEERSFVMGHETMHVLLNHLMLLRKGKESGKFPNMRKFNIAADCVINDYLVSMGLEPGRLADFGAFGPNIVGYDCANATVGEVYLDIPDADESEDGKGEEGEGEEGEGQPGQGGGGSGSGDPLEDFMKAAGAAQSFDDHEWMDANDPAQEQAAEDIAQDGKDKGNGMPEDLEDKKEDGEGESKYGSPGGGPGNDKGKMTKWQEQAGVSMAWAELLKEIDPDMFKKGGPPMKPSYHQPRRKLGGVNAMRRSQGQRPIMLPVIRKVDGDTGEIPSIFMALDVSGSCAHHANTFVTLARSVPQDKIKLHVATFSTVCNRLDLENPKWIGGGTSFGPVEQYIRTHVTPEFGHYPKAVIMVTDGEGSFNGTRPSVEDAEKWLWLITDNGYHAYPDTKTVGRTLSYENYALGVKGAKI